MPEITREELYRLYIDEAKNRYEISGITGLKPARIGTLLQMYGIRRYSVARHHKYNHPLYTVWTGMKERCRNANAENFQWYGGKGVSVCDAWQSFEVFFQWAEKSGWQPGLTIDRIDGNAGYSPENCRWITHRNQCRNRKSNLPLTVNGETLLMCEWEERLGLPRKTLAKWKFRHDTEFVRNKIGEMMRDV